MALENRSHPSRLMTIALCGCVSLAASFLVKTEASATKDSSYQLTCSNISVKGDTLSADCRKRNQAIKHTSIRILGIDNIDGDLKDNGTKKPSTYQNSCNKISVAGATLSANCRKINGRYKSTSILIPRIQNIDGTLSY
jgi:hypothetical protein